MVIHQLVDKHLSFVGVEPDGRWRSMYHNIHMYKVSTTLSCPAYMSTEHVYWM